MPRISIQKPTDQPTGRKRLLEEIRSALISPEFQHFQFVVAFAKAGPLLRLSAELGAWRANGKKVQAIIGINEQGTSVEALAFALANFDETFIAYVPGAFSPVFHPKIYLLKGPRRAIAFIGSNNLTVGGTEINLECHLRIELDLPADHSTLSDISAVWGDALQVSNRLTADLLLELQRANLVLPQGANASNGSRLSDDE